MRILSFDTSASATHLSLLQDRTIVLEREITPTSANRSEVASQIMPEIDKAFRELCWDRRELSLIVVGTGPGSFTGIRVAVITARTLAQVLRLPLLGVSSLESLYAGSELDSPAGIVLSTTSNQFFFGAFQRTEEDPAFPASVAGAGPLAVLSESLEPVPVWLADEQACSVIGDPRCAPLPKLKNIATTQAQLALDRLSLKGLFASSQNGKQKLVETFPWWDVLPLYLRSPSVTLKKTYADQNTANEPG